MAEKESDNSGFRVVDKRRFEGSGDIREGMVERSETDRVSTVSSASIQQAAMSAEKPKAAAEYNPPAGASRERAAPRTKSPGATPTVDFSSLIMSLATQALVMMGEIPSPDGGQSARNLDGAQQTVDIISMLFEKTQGNLSEEEQHLIEEVLAQLRLAFVNSVGK